MKRLVVILVVLAILVLCVCPTVQAASLQYIDEKETLRIGKESQDIMMKAQNSLSAFCLYVNGVASALRFPVNTSYKQASVLEYIKSKTQNMEAIGAAVFVINITIEQNIKHLRESLDDLDAAMFMAKTSDEKSLGNQTKKCLKDILALLEDMKERCSGLLKK